MKNVAHFQEFLFFQLFLIPQKQIERMIIDVKKLERFPVLLFIWYNRYLKINIFMIIYKQIISFRSLLLS